MTINFPRSLTIEACESVIHDVNELDGDSKLILPVDTERQNFGGLACAIQAVNTWGRNSESRQLLLRESVKSLEDRVQDVINMPHKFVAAMWAKSIALENDEAEDIRKRINLKAKEAIEEQERSGFGQHHGRRCWFAFIDHSTKGFDRNFYFTGPDQKPYIRQPMQIQSIIGAMVKQSITVAGGGVVLSEDDRNSLGRLFLELFLNTHEHGSRGLVRSEWLKPGVRAIYTNGINLANDDAEGMLKNEPALAKYLKAQAPNLDDKCRFVEISIVDSGLGYCRRWLADNEELDSVPPMTLEDEYKIFKRCFKFRQTSTGQGGKGNGLPVVMERLTKLRGFMRVRSGRLALYRDFISAPYQPNDLCDFTDWSSQKEASEELSEMGSAEGVAITLLVPLESKR